MANPTTSRILLAALTTLLIQALEDEETRHLATDRLRDDLRALLALVEEELDRTAHLRHLRVAESKESGVGDN
jgi:hypothetical protein